ncbi:MAG: NAD(P)H-hydrate dehydratase [Dissulfurispiraceae bacterium]|jgi:NAD(P)H-hydrate epimerase|nr:NAD(P)H-hydrate dehydratase [Dissulfurispiraceae bacterium]
MKIATSSEMLSIDMTAISEYGIKSSLLMFRAGAALADHAHALFPKRNIFVLCGCGNNGGDGFVAARRLKSKKHKVRAVVLCDKKSMSTDCLREYKAARKSGVKIEFCPAIEEMDFRDCVVIDAIFGTGLKRKITGYIGDVISKLNASGVQVISADIPSGISADTGKVCGAAVKANHTITFGLPKRGHFLYPGAEYSGNLVIDNIGFPDQLLAAEDINIELLNRFRVSSFFEKRDILSHKGAYGHVLVLAGSKGKTGAAKLAARACLRSGAGLVTLGVPESLIDIYQSCAVEEMVHGMPDGSNGSLSSQALEQILNLAGSSIDVIAAGPGMGVSADTERLMADLVVMSPAPLVIDADGLNSLSSRCGQKMNLQDIFQNARSPVVLTPHSGEMKRLCASAGIKEADRIANALELSRKTGAVVVLKGAYSVVADPASRVFINSTGNPGMATAGSGDVLTGIIAAFVGQGMAPFHAAVAGVFIHGLAGDTASDIYGQYSLLATDIIEFLPKAFKVLDI